jgi:hypothetical protein
MKDEQGPVAASRSFSGADPARGDGATRNVGARGAGNADAGGSAGAPADIPKAGSPAPDSIVRHAISRDGTPIAYAASGAGPVLVLVHGTGDSRTRWTAVTPGLSWRFRLFAMDRRGRGQSADSPVYSLEREIEDVQAVISEAGGRVSLLTGTIWKGSTRFLPAATSKRSGSLS